MKVISIYELLNLIKEGKQPNKIKYFGNIYEWEEDWYMTKEKNYKVCLGGKKDDGNQLINAFNENIEIIEEDKEIEEINIEWFKQVDMFDAKSVELAIEAIAKQLNELIKAVNELKKGK